MIGRLARRAWTIGLVALIVPGCLENPPGDEVVLRVATSWGESARQEVERAFSGSIGKAGVGRPPRILWVGSHGDVRLGGPVADHPPGAVVVRRTRIGLSGGKASDRPTTWDGLADEKNAGRLAIGDPRHDPVARELASRWLAADGLSATLERLGRLYARAALVPVGSAKAAVDRGRADWALTVDSEAPLGPAVELEEAASISPTAANTEIAEAFLAFLRDRGPRPEARPESPGTRELLADLLGSILVDAREGLASGPLGSPPWPPASVRALRDREDGDGLVGLLAEQLVPDADARDWLLRSWDEVGQVDGDRLAGLAGAVDGRLLREPRFRAWLRGEWTAWARGLALAGGSSGARP